MTSRLAPAESPVCDRCGRPEQARYRFCQGCHMFVCAGCWDSGQAVCLNCSRPNLPAPGDLRDSIRVTIGRRSLAPATSVTRVGRALTGPGVASAPSASTSRRTAPPPSRGLSLAALALVALIASAVLFAVVMFGVPLLSSLLADQSQAPSPPAVSVPAAGDRQSGQPSAPAARSYVVRSGDSLRSIAFAMYGDEERWVDIYAANAKQIDNPDSLVVGTTLTIPDR